MTAGVRTFSALDPGPPLHNLPRSTRRSLIVPIRRGVLGGTNVAQCRGVDTPINIDRIDFISAYCDRWNGSAKVALISIRRSIAAWTTIAQATRDPDAEGVAEELRRLEVDVERTFPDAWTFVRPGLDQVP